MLLVVWIPMFKRSLELQGPYQALWEKSNPHWNQVFAFSKERIQASVLEVVIKDKDVVVEDFVGRVMFDINEIPKLYSPFLSSFH